MWFDRAVAAEADGTMTYVKYIMCSRPKRGGSIQEMEAIAELCYEARRPDTSVSLFYATIMFQIAQDLNCDLREVFTRPGVRDKCVEVLTAQAQNPKNVSDMRNLAAELLPVVEYVAGDLEKSLDYNRQRRAARAVHGRDFLPNDYDRIFTVLNKLAWSKNGSRLVAIEELFRAGQYQEALAKVTDYRNEAKLKGGIDLLPYEEANYLYHRISCLEIETLFKKGEWMSPTLKKWCPGWFNPEKSWSCNDNGLFTTGQMSPLELMALLPADVECEGVIRFMAPAGQESRLCLQLNKLGVQSEIPVSFCYEERSCRVTVGSHYDISDKSPVALPCEKPEAQFRMVLLNNRVSVWVNGKQIIDKKEMLKPTGPLRKDGVQSLSLYGTCVGVSDLRMRAPDVSASGGQSRQ